MVRMVRVGSYGSYWFVWFVHNHMGSMVTCGYIKVTWLHLYSMGTHVLYGYNNTEWE